jgi:fatty-acyl-CoA synthase
MQSKVYRSELTPVSFLQRSVAVFPDKVAVVHENRQYTYREFAARVNRFASHLRESGLCKHDPLAVLSPNTPALLEAHFAVPAAGGVLVALNTRLQSHEIAFILKHAGAKILFVDRELAHLVDQRDPELAQLQVLRIDDTGLDSDPYERFLDAGSPEPLTTWLEDEEETISINYTSGTTGVPKGVMYSYRGAYLNALAQVVEAGLNSSSVYLWTLPMFHCNGWCFPWAVTAVGGTHVCLRKVEPERIWELLEWEGITHYNGAPTVQIFLVNHPKAHRLARQVTVMVAGAPPSPTLLGQLNALNIHPIHVYGLTETYGPYTVCEWHREWDTLSYAEQARLMARQGQNNVIADAVRVIADSSGPAPTGSTTEAAEAAGAGAGAGESTRTEVGSNGSNGSFDGYPESDEVAWDGDTMGEVVMRGNTVMKGYYRDPETTARAFAGGWFHSGDVGVRHSDGYIELRDRSKDIIISGGENISSIEVEQVLAQHPAVLECAIIAIPDEKWGERPKAFVTLKSGMSATEAELIAFCREHLAHFKCPVAVDFTTLPKTSTGKIQKYLLRQRDRDAHKNAV